MKILINNFITVAQQILILFILIFSGFVCQKKSLISNDSIKTLTNIALYLAAPCVIIKSFIREFSFEVLESLIISLALSLFIHIVSIAIAHIVFRSKNIGSAERVYRFSIVFSNAGFMALPLQQAILGDNGVFFGSSYVSIFNILLWTYGVSCMSKDKESFSLKKIINPGIVAVLIGFLIFIFSIDIHPVIVDAITHFANLNTPIPMLIIGFYLAKSDIIKSLKNKKLYLTIFLRLIFVPFLVLAIMYFIGIRSDLLVSMTIAASAPVATGTTMFALMYKTDEKLSVNLVSLTTLMSVITMPVIVALAQYLA